MTTDTKAVARYDSVDGCEVATDGDYVLFTDHERVVGELEGRIGYLRTALAASRAEVGGLKDMIRTMQNNPEFDFDAAMEKGNV